MKKTYRKRIQDILVSYTTDYSGDTEININEAERQLMVIIDEARAYFWKAGFREGYRIGVEEEIELKISEKNEQ